MRRHDLDWLRVLVFALLIFYHVGMFFVPWGWHIKNEVEYSWLRYPMLFLNQWRLPILFVISGMGTFYALNKRSSTQFVSERFRRLFLPLVVGMLLIVPPQVYIERLYQGQIHMSYFEFWPAKAFVGVYPEGNLSWHHLWFLPYLLLFSLVLVPVFLKLKKSAHHRLIILSRKWVSSPVLIFLFIIPLYLAESLLEPFFPVTHALVDDVFSLVYFGFLFLFGFLLMTVQDAFWQTVKQNRRKFLIVAILAFTLWMGLVFSFQDSVYRHFTEALVKVFNVWAWILTCFGYAATYLNRPSFLLSYANEAVYPFYILHQTITIITAYFLWDLNWGLWSKFAVLLSATFFGSWLIYEFLIRRWRFIRPLFGLKVNPKTPYLTAVEK